MGTVPSRPLPERYVSVQIVSEDIRRRSRRRACEDQHAERVIAINRKSSHEKKGRRRKKNELREETSQHRPRTFEMEH